MWSWIAIGALYAVMLGGFRLLGGIGSAMEAVRDWGRASVSGAAPPVSSS